MTEEYYVIDTSSLIDLNKFNPIDLYPSVWKRLEDLIKKNQLIAPIEVLNEVTRQDDAIAKWAKKHKFMFKPVTKRQAEIVSQILTKYPSIVNPNREFDADPWVIALAVELTQQKTLISIKWLVVTEERLKGNSVRIPLICKDFNIEYLKIFDMFRRRGWIF